jgi:transcriptional/translational regulatory protein YebC/TACO1
VLKKARDANCPKDIIDRNLKRSGDSNQANFSELTYEAYGIGGVGIVIESLTDNNNRTNSEVRPCVNVMMSNHTLANHTLTRHLAR